MTRQSVFEWHLTRRTWELGGGSVSGLGSTVAATAQVRSSLPELIKAYAIKSILDIPCGDGTWISHCDLGLELYIGADIVRQLVDLNAARSGGVPNRKFQRLDLTCDPLPRVDLVFCRDCLVHLSNELIFQALENIRKSGSRYLIATTFPEHTRNVDIITGDWRPLNLQKEPFGFPTPLEIIREGLEDHDYYDKSLGLWRVADIAHHR